MLEALRQNCDVEKVVFVPTSTVYGDVTMFPTNESYGPLKPISMDGASRLASEALVSSYANLHNFDALMLRFANVIGSRSQSRVIHDFLNVKEEPGGTGNSGDGRQGESYVYVNDCVNATLVACEGISSENF